LYSLIKALIKGLIVLTTVRADDTTINPEAVHVAGDNKILKKTFKTLMVPVCAGAFFFSSVFHFASL